MARPERSEPAEFKGSFDEAVERFETSGFMLARLETICAAGCDKRIDRTCLEVLICLVRSLNRDTLTTFIGRDKIAETVDISVKSVSNYLSQLRALGYIASAYRPTPEANNRQLLHYTLTALSPEEIEKAIDHAVASLRGQINTVRALPTSRNSGKSSSRNSGKSVASSHSDGKSSSCPDGKSSESSCPNGKSSSRPDGRSNTTSPPTTVEPSGEGVEGGASPSAQPPPKEPAKKKARGTRLPKDWVLKRSLGQWTIENFVVPSDDDVRAEAEKFKNHWLSSAGSNATKLDWDRAWQKWCGNVRHWRRRRVDRSIAPDLPSTDGEAKSAAQREIEQLVGGRR